MVTLLIFYFQCFCHIHLLPGDVCGNGFEVCLDGASIIVCYHCVQCSLCSAWRSYWRTLDVVWVEHIEHVLGPHTVINIHQLEAVLRRATRFATGDYYTVSSTSQMISRLAGNHSNTEGQLPR